jgi:4-aminobutyrate aminotransferase-like enzyme
VLHKLKNQINLEAEVQKLVQKVVKEAEAINDVREAQEDLTEEYKKLLEEIGKYRGRPLYWPYITSGLGNGPYVQCQDGSVKLDLINGIGVHLLGHSHPRVLAAGVHGALQDTANQGHLQPGEEYVEMSRKLVALAKNSRLKHVWLSTCGTMANENALKMARQKNSPAKYVISVENAFSGRSTMMAEITDNPDYKQGLPAYNEVLRIPFYDKTNPRSREIALSALREHIAKFPNQIAAFCFEPMLGEGGYRSAPLDFFIPLFEECRKNKIAIWADEVQTFLRTGEAFAFQTMGFGEYVDLCTVAKTVQVAATLYTEEYNPKPGLIAGTFAGATSALAAGNAILDEMSEGYFGPQGKIQKIHQKFIQEFKKSMEGACRGLLEDPDGLGLMIAVTPFSGDKDKVNQLIKVLFKNGLMCYTCGKKPVRLRFLVPAIIQDRDIEKAVKIIEKSILEIAQS